MQIVTIFFYNNTVQTSLTLHTLKTKHKRAKENKYLSFLAVK